MFVELVADAAFLTAYVCDGLLIVAYVIFVLGLLPRDAVSSLKCGSFDKTSVL